MFWIKIAGEDERQPLYRVRHDVFVGGGWYAPRPDGRITDEYDNRSSTVQLDFGNPVDLERAVSGSMYCVAEWARSARLALRLVRMALDWAEAGGWSHIVAAANPDLRSMFERTGGEAVSEAVLDRPSGLPVLPIILNCDRSASKSHSLLERTFYHGFYEPGDVVFERGAPGGHAYVVIHREVELSTAGGCVVIGQGEPLGDQALLCNGTSVATGRARTACVLMVADRPAFERQIGRPEGLRCTTRSRRLADPIQEARLGPNVPSDDPIEAARQHDRWQTGWHGDARGGHGR